MCPLSVYARATPAERESRVTAVCVRGKRRVKIVCDGRACAWGNDAGVAGPGPPIACTGLSDVCSKAPRIPSAPSRLVVSPMTKEVVFTEPALPCSYGGGDWVWNWWQGQWVEGVWTAASSLCCLALSRKRCPLSPSFCRGSWAPEHFVFVGGSLLQGVWVVVP